MTSSSDLPLREKIEIVLKSFEITAQVLAEELRITPEWMSRIRRDKEEGSDDIRLRLDEFLRRRKLDPTSFFTADSLQVREDALKQGETHGGAGSRLVRSGADDKTGTRMQVTPKYAGEVFEPSEQQCINYFLRYIEQARKTPGGLGHTWIELHRNFPLDRMTATSEAKKNLES